MAAPSSDSNTFRFLITTDNHLGYQEKDPRRCHDAFVTFEECLRAATVTHKVDAILLAGDLFHESKPSLHVMHRSMGLLRKYVMGGRPISFTMLSDPSLHFPNHPVPCANFQDPNLNVAVPIFTIHGNHDDPLGDKSPSPVDLLAAAGLVNHFGHVPSIDSIVVRPILLQKGTTFIALYGLGAMHDQRLHRCFERRQIQFIKPLDPPSVRGARWFNILLLHQNRGIRVGAGGGLGSQNKAGIPESMLRGYGFDLVIWGNEHEQLIMPQASEGFDIIQPGSTVMTSLSASESNPKQYGVLEVRGGQYRVTPHPLTSIRPVVRRQVELWRDQPQARSLAAVEEYLRLLADEMLGEAEDMIARIPDDVLAFHPDLKFPLMRLSVDFTSPDGGPAYPQPNAIRFGQQFMEVVVNASDVLKPMKPKARPNSVNTAIFGGNGAHEVVPNGATRMLSTADIRSKIASVFNANARDACTLLSEPEVASSIYLFADKDDRGAIDATIERLVLESNKSIWKTLRKGKEDLAQLREDKVRDLALKYKLDTTRKFLETSGHDDPAADIAPADILEAHHRSHRGGAGQEPHPDDAEVFDLLGIRSVGGGHALGAPLPSRVDLLDHGGAAVGAALPHDQNAAADEEDAALDAELDRLLPKGTLLASSSAAAPLGRPAVAIVDDDEDQPVLTAAAATTRGGRGRGGRGSGTTTAKTKRGRDDEDDEVEFVSQRGGRGGGRRGRGGALATTTSAAAAAAAAAGPQLTLTKGAVAKPATHTAANAINNVVSQWTR